MSRAQWRLAGGGLGPGQCMYTVLLSPIPGLVQCSVECGAGQQHREVVCGGAQCQAATRPAAARPCDAGRGRGCGQEWLTGRWSGGRGGAGRVGVTAG